VFAELERLKTALRLRNVEQPAARSTNRPIDAALIVTSDLPDIDWGSLGAGAAAATAAASVDTRFGAEAAEWLARSSAYGAAAGGAAAAFGPGSSSGAAYGAAAAASTSSVARYSSGGGGSYTAGSSGGAPAAAYQSSYVPSSQQSLDKHALFAPRTSSASRTSTQQQQPRPRYPDFDKTPSASIDLLWQPQQQSSGSLDPSAAAQASAPSAPPEDALTALSLEQRRASGSAAGSLMDAPMAPHPSAGPSLGPQELQVHSMDASQGRPGGTCAMHAGVGERGGGGGMRPLEKRVEMRDVHISVALMNDFLHYASTNTRRCVAALWCWSLAVVYRSWAQERGGSERWVQISRFASALCKERATALPTHTHPPPPPLPTHAAQGY